MYKVSVAEDGTHIISLDPGTKLILEVSNTKQFITGHTIVERGGLRARMVIECHREEEDKFCKPIPVEPLEEVTSRKPPMGELGQIGEHLVPDGFTEDDFERPFGGLPRHRRFPE